MTNLNLSLVAKTRELQGKRLKKLKEQGQVPAVLYGHKIDSQNLAVDYSKFEKIYQQAGESTLIDLIIDDKKPVPVLIQDFQREPMTNRFLHIDFYQVRMDEKLRTEISLKFIGEAPAVKELSGVLVTNMDTIKVECLPKDLVHEIEVDLSKLKTFEDLIHIADVPVPAGITILDPPDEVVVLVQQPRSEKELESLAEKPAEVVPAEKVEKAEVSEAVEEVKEEKS